MNDVLELLEMDMSDPGSVKSGEYLRDHVLQHVRSALTTDRSGVVDALREWLNSRSEPRTMLAVSVARKLGLKELKTEVELIRDEVLNGRIFPMFYLDRINAALDALT
jgi:hypothetical protein